MKVLIEHKETEVVQLENYFKQIAVSFKIYADFECNVKGAKGNNKNNNSSYTENYQSHVPCTFAYKIVYVLMIYLAN